MVPYKEYIVFESLVFAQAPETLQFHEEAVSVFRNKPTPESEAQVTKIQLIYPYSPIFFILHPRQMLWVGLYSPKSMLKP